MAQALQAGAQAPTTSPRGVRHPCFCPRPNGSSPGLGTLRGLNTASWVDILVTILYMAAFSELLATSTLCLSFLICTLPVGVYVRLKCGL